MPGGKGTRLTAARTGRKMDSKADVLQAKPVARLEAKATRTSRLQNRTQRRQACR